MVLFVFLHHLCKLLRKSQEINSAILKYSKQPWHQQPTVSPSSEALAWLDSRMNDHGVCVFSINDAGMLQSLHEYVSMSTYVHFMSSLTNRKSDCYFWTRLDWNRKNRVTDRRGGVRKHHNTHTHTFWLWHPGPCFPSIRYGLLLISFRMSSNLLKEKFQANVLFWKPEDIPVSEGREKKYDSRMIYYVRIYSFASRFMREQSVKGCGGDAKTSFHQFVRNKRKI